MTEPIHSTRVRLEPLRAGGEGYGPYDCVYFSVTPYSFNAVLTDRTQIYVRFPLGEPYSLFTVSL